MKVIIIDNRVHRHQQLIDMIDKSFEENDVQSFSTIHLDRLRELKPDLLLVHENNPEAAAIENDPTYATYTILFSGGLTGNWPETEYMYSAGIKYIPQALSEISRHMVS